tara:strand:- start:161 stop:283 length:123 start_codon:yes stop_codon:yes gene_type:complete
VTYIKEKNMDKLLNQIKHLWTDHKKLVIGVVVVMIILAIS